MLVLKGHTDTIRSLSYAPDGRTLASGSQDGTVCLWDPRTGEELKCLKCHGGSVEVVVYAPDGADLAVGMSDGMVAIGGVGAGWRTFPPQHTQGVRVLSFSPQGRVLVSGGWDGRIVVWDREQRRERFALEPEAGACTAGCWSSQGAYLALAFHEGSVRLHAHGGRTEDRRLKLGTTQAFSLAFSPDERMVATGDTSGNVRLWDIKTGEEFGVPGKHTRAVYALAFSPDGKTLASAGVDATVIFWDVGTGHPRHTFTWGQRWITSLVFAPDGLTAAVAGADHTVVIWDVDSWS